MYVCPSASLQARCVRDFRHDRRRGMLVLEAPLWILGGRGMIRDPGRHFSLRVLRPVRGWRQRTYRAKQQTSESDSGSDLDSDSRCEGWLHGSDRSFSPATACCDDRKRCGGAGRAVPLASRCQPIAALKNRLSSSRCNFKKTLDRQPTGHRETRQRLRVEDRLSSAAT
ncbi:conserved hypothetical protein [Coccidioides posadasii str. Silveira]|uniref:Uncharacterized protein n=1 Tax=Coccidioides posadasii (strain RMSCC 757 / Silveira) TaxID=443226 RepID=E9D0A6_COCPS|nr:conserved hypothetical protein [Coccidioides posadasii str. Silveira]